ncbi:hypothetical protein B7486_54470 [cyanobacterium TDX16]|nr:hypothetical protein B7486_54470 [cyanobacterium TDX16]
MHRLSPRRALALAVLFASGLFLGSVLGGTALAAITFSDVGPNHPFRDEIGWLTDQGIANGYPDGTFRGGDPVTRQAMAAFLARTSSATYLAEHEEDPVGGINWSAHAECDEGDRALGGGGFINQGEIMVTGSAPGGAEGERWYVTFESDDNTVINPSVLRVWALCAPQPLDGPPEL